MLRDVLKLWSPRVEAAAGQRQAGALPYAVVDGRVTFLLITARRSGRWIFPKGAIEPHLTPWESAAEEAREEAGVIGTIEQQPIGSYRASAGSDNSILVDVDLYPMLVHQQLDEWKEHGQRLRHWALLHETKRLLLDPQIARLAVRLHRRLTKDAQPTVSSSSK